MNPKNKDFSVIKCFVLLKLIFLIFENFVQLRNNCHSRCCFAGLGYPPKDFDHLLSK